MDNLTWTEYLSGAPQSLEFLHIGEDEVYCCQMVHTHDGKDNEISDVDRILLTETGKLKGYVALV